jgi:hypothetical protein
MSRQPNLIATLFVAASRALATYACASSVGVKAKAKKQPLI